MSSLGGSSSKGNFSRSLVTVSYVSSTLRVVCDSHATLLGSLTSTASTSSGCCTSVMWSGASPVVPSTSSWPAWPMSRISTPSAANRVASLWTLVTSGQVASIVLRPRAAASACTCGETPCAENTTVDPCGTSASSSTNTAPRASRSSTCLLYTSPSPETDS